MPRGARDPVALGGILGFLRVLWALDRGLHLVSKRMEMDRGVTGRQRLLMRIVADRPHLAPGQLAEVLHLDPSTVTGLVKRLEKVGFVQRLPDSTDGRRVAIALTAAGSRVLTSGAHTVEELVEKALAVFPRAKVHATEEVLGTLTTVLERAAAR